MRNLFFTLVLCFALPQVSYAETSTGTGEVEQTSTSEGSKAEGEVTGESSPTEEPKAEVSSTGEDPVVETPVVEVPAEVPEVTNDEEALEAANQLKDAFENGNWYLVVAILLALGLYGLRRFKLVKKKADSKE